LILGLILISVFWRYKKLAVTGFCFVFLVLGMWRYEIRELKIENNDLLEYNDRKENIVLVGQVISEPDVRQSSVKLAIGQIEIVEDSPKQVEGRILVTVNKYPEYRYGDKLKISGKLLTPQEFEEFNYKNYLAKDGVFAVMYYPKAELAEQGLGSLFYTKILETKERLREGLSRNLSPPQSSVLGAIILGDKRQISEDFAKKLNYAGLRHLTAVSGMHVAILTTISMSFLVGLGFWRRQAFWLALVLIVLFIALTGFQSSAVRAGIMGMFFLLSQYLGKTNSSLRILVFAAALMLAQNPLLLKLDVGFQLSFLAMLGIMQFNSLFQRRFNSVLSMTLSAQIFTLPVLIYNFGYFSLVAPLTNLLVLPLLPFIMGLGFLSGLAGLIWVSLGWFLSLPVNILLIYLTKIADVFSAIPWSSYSLEISWVWLLVSYAFLGFFAWRFNHRQELKFLRY